MRNVALAKVDLIIATSLWFRKLLAPKKGQVDKDMSEYAEFLPNPNWQLAGERPIWDIILWILSIG
jgi:hypothetical protein